MKTIIKENLKFEVNHINDTYMDPRQDFNLGTMFCLHKKYNLGDKHNYSGSDFSSWKEVKEFLNSMTQEQFNKMREFFDTLPRLRKEIAWTCSGCGKEDSVVVEGLQNFFT